jgi:ABC-type sugar transport system permease subunit
MAQESVRRKVSWRVRLRADRTPGARPRAVFVGASLTPVMAIFMVFSILPIIAVVAFSFFRYSFTYPDHAFHGLSYYQQLTTDPLFWNGLKRTALFVVLAVPLNIVVGLSAALGLQRVTRFKGTLRAFFFLPTMISTVAVSLLGLALYDPTTGLINQALGGLHLPLGHWLSDNTTALPALVVLAVWQDVGYNVIIFLAGLQAIPHDFYEAARIDGAGRLATFRHITLPLLQRTTSFTVILTVISYLQVFTYQQVMLQGGPDDSTRTLSLYIYDIGIGTVTPLLSQAMAAAVVLLLVTLAITLFQLRLTRIQWDY